jgi:hypothetical protein
MPAIAGPFAGAPPQSSFQHAMMSLNVFINCLQHPPAAYPALASLASGMCICNVQTTWANGMFCSVVYKP